MRPGPLLRRVLRAPVRLYDIGAGRLFGHRFPLLTHRGRRSGRLYRTMLEVVDWDADRREATVISGFGEHAAWFLNVRDGGAAEVRIGAEAFRPAVRRLEPEEAIGVIAGYESRNRILASIIRKALSRLASFHYDGSRRAESTAIAANRRIYGPHLAVSA